MYYHTISWFDLCNPAFIRLSDEPVSDQCQHRTATIRPSPRDRCFFHHGVYCIIRSEYRKCIGSKFTGIGKEEKYSLTVQRQILSTVLFRQKMQTQSRLFMIHYRNLQCL